jgi:putative Ca2+/H+ antiporter (TMEM165/GDT1 family)
VNLGAAFSAFAAVFPAELPDKTMVATIVLVTRYRRPVAVWLGAAAAFAAHVVIAVAAGGLLSLLPDTVVTISTAALFSAGAVVLWRSARRHDAEVDLDAAITGNRVATFGAAALGSFGVVILAEWGDLTQLATASIAASTGEPVAVAVGALLALWTVAALAVTAGRLLAGRLPIALLQRIAAAVFATLAAVTLTELL